MADGNDLEKLLSEVEREELEAPERLKARIHAWALRLQGYSVADIAEDLGVTNQTAYNHLEWAQKNLPSAHRSAEDFIRTSIDRLEVQYRQLSIGRELGSEMAHRVSAALVDQQAKMLGVYTMKLDVKAEVKYVIDGVDMDQV